MGQPIYHEEIGPSMAEMILQEEFVKGDNMRYYVISELYGTVILQYNAETGEQLETKLEEPCNKESLDVPKIEKFKFTYKESKPLGIRVQIALSTIVLVLVGACFAWLLVMGGG